MQKQQGEVYELITKIEEIAVEMEMKMRFLDAIQDLKKTLKKSLSQQELRKVIVEIDELIIQIRKQIEPEQKEIIVNESLTVSEADVKNKIQKMLMDASQRNYSLFVENMMGSEIYIREAERATWDFTKTEANYEVISDTRRLYEKFDYIGKRHNQIMNQMMESYIEDVAANYDNCMSRIGKMLNEIGDSSLKFGQKELYQKWSECAHVIKNKVKEEMEQIDKGGRVIVDFISGRENALEKILKKIRKKYFIKKGMPLYILLFIVFLVIGLLVWLVSNVANLIGSSIEGLVSLIQEGSLDGVANKVLEKFGGKLGDFLLGVLKDVISGATAITGTTAAGAATTAGVTTAATVTVPGIVIFLIVFGILWYLWIKHQNRKCKKQICEKTGKYLNEQLEIFWKEKPLHKQLEASCDTLVEKVTSIYENAIMQIFGGILYNETDDIDSPIHRMRQLCSEWEKIKRGEI